MMIFKKRAYIALFIFCKKVLTKDILYCIMNIEIRNKVKTMTIIKNLLLMILITFGWVIFPFLTHFIVEDWLIAIFWGELAYLVFFLVQTALVGNQEYRIYK